MSFGLDENGNIIRMPFCQEEGYILNIDKNGKMKKVPFCPLLDIMGEENYKKFKENQLKAEIENNKNKKNDMGKEIYKKFKEVEIENSKNNFMSHLVEVKKEEDAPTTFE